MQESSHAGPLLAAEGSYKHTDIAFPPRVKQAVAEIKQKIRELLWAAVEKYRFTP